MFEDSIKSDYFAFFKQKQSDIMIKTFQIIIELMFLNPLRKEVLKWENRMTESPPTPNSSKLVD